MESILRNKFEGKTIRSGEGFCWKAVFAFKAIGEIHLLSLLWGGLCVTRGVLCS